MMPPRLRLKKPTGWFAAGQEVAAALEMLSAEAFKLYLYLCLHAERHTGRIAWQPGAVVRLFRGGGEVVPAALEELCRQQVCGRADASAVEICDRFWPYEKAAANSGTDLAGYVEQVRQMLLRPACGRASFSAADERLAGHFQRRGVTLTELQRAIWLGCARKYVALRNGQTPLFITRLHYFSGLVEEVVSTRVSESDWRHVQRKTEQLERRWIGNQEARRRGSDEMMKTKYC